MDCISLLSLATTYVTAIFNFGFVVNAPASLNNVGASGSSRAVAKRSCRLDA